MNQSQPIYITSNHAKCQRGIAYRALETAMKLSRTSKPHLLCAIMRAYNLCYRWDRQQPRVVVAKVSRLSLQHACNLTSLRRAMHGVFLQSIRSQVKCKIYEIFATKICMTLNVKIMSVESLYMTSYTINSPFTSYSQIKQNVKSWTLKMKARQEKTELAPFDWKCLFPYW